MVIKRFEHIFIHLDIFLLAQFTPAILSQQERPIFICSFHHLAKRLKKLDIVLNSSSSLIWLLFFAWG